VKCLFCKQPVEEQQEIADVFLGEAEKTNNGELEDLSYTGEIETGHLNCLEKARDQFHWKGGV